MIVVETKQEMLIDLQEMFFGDKILFVDLDHTLFLNPFWPSVFPEVGQKIAAASGTTPEEVMSAVVSYSRDLIRIRDLRAYDWDFVISQVAFNQFNFIWDEPIVDLVMKGISSSQLIDGAIQSLVDAKDLGWTVVAASQGFRRYQEPVLDYLGLSEKLDMTRFSDDYAQLKRTLDFYGPIPDGSKVVILGDKYVDDSLYPENFGFGSIWFTGVYRDKKIHSHLSPSAEIDDLRDLKQTLDRIEKDLKVVSSTKIEKPCFSCSGATSHSDGLCDLCAQVYIG